MADFSALPTMQIRPWDAAQNYMDAQKAIGATNENMLFPLKQQQMANQNALEAFKTKAAKTSFNNDLLAQALEDADTPEAFEDALTRAQAAGADPAFLAQFKGRWTPERADTWKKIYGTPAAAGGARGGAGGGNALAGTGGGGDFSPSQQYDMNNWTPDQVNERLGKANGVRDELHRVYNSKDPLAEWQRIQGSDPDAAKVDLMDGSGRIDRGKLMRAMTMADQLQSGLQDRAQQLGLGIPAPRNAPDLKVVGNDIFSLDPYNQTTPVKRVGTGSVAPNQQLVGYTEEGYPIYHDVRGGPDIIGKTKIATGRYNTPSAKGGGRGNTQAERFADRFKEIHKNDPIYENNPGKLEEDAMNFGRGFMKPPKDMSDTEIAIAAARAAFGDPKAEQEYVDQFKAARAADRARVAAGPPGKAQTPAPTGPLRNAAPPVPNAAAINHLKENPGLRADFDKKFGAGAAARYLQ